MKKLAFPIRLKVLVAVLIMLMLAVGIITATMANLFQQDKTAYVRDFSVAVAGNMQSEADAVLGAHLSATRVLAEVLFADYLDPGAKQLLAEPLFGAYPDLLALVTTSAEGEPVSLYNTAALRDAGIEAEEIMAASSLIELYEGEDLQVRRTAFRSGAGAVSLTVGHRMPDAESDMPVVAIVYSESLNRALNRGKPFDAVLLDADMRPILASGAIATTTDWTQPALTKDDNYGSSGAFEYTSGGNEYIAGFSRTSIGDLTVITQISASAAYLTARQLLDELIFVGLVLILVAALGGVVVSRRITGPLERLSKAVRTVAKGDFKVNVAINSADEIGELSTSFNNMADELHERDESLKNAQDALIQSEKMAAVGTLSAGLAHEVKNPLSAVLGYAQLSKRKLDQPEKLKAHLDTIEHETRRCTDIIGNLMQFSRREKGDLSQISVNEVVSKSIAIVDHQLSLQGVTIESSLDESLPDIYGNANQLQQVLMNLMINAQQAIGEDGGKVMLSTRSEAGSVVISVADTGPGMDKDVAAKVFEPFFTTKPAGQGTGLGLSVTYGIIQDHGGDISVKRADVGGADFMITLPLMSQNPVALEQAS
jgi:signal transduction histidine kinase